MDKPTELLERMFQKIKNDSSEEEEIPNFLSNMIEENKDLNIASSRNKEIQKIIEILARKNKGNVILIGETGVGKTSIVEQLANRIAKKRVPDFLFDCTIYNLDFNKFISNTGIRGMYEEKISQLRSFLYNTKGVLFIDEIHSVFNHNKYFEPSSDLLSQLKTDLARGKIRIIGTTTLSELGDSIQNDPALSRRIQTVYIQETSYNETLRVLISVKEELESYHEVTISGEAILSCIRCCDSFITDKYFPDKAIEILDLSCSRVRINRYSVMRKIENIQEEKENIFSSINFTDNKKDISKAEKKYNALNLEEEKYNLEYLEEKSLINELSDCRRKIENYQSDLEELKNFDTEYIINNTKEIFSKERNRETELLKKIKIINPSFKLTVYPEDIYESLEDLQIIKKETFSPNYTKLLSKNLNSLFPFILEKEIEKIINGIKTKISNTENTKNNGFLSCFFLFDEENHVTKDLMNSLNETISFNNVKLCEINVINILNTKDQYLFWKEKLNQGHRVFVVNLDKKNINDHFFFNNKNLIQEGKIRNYFGSQCSLAGSILFFRFSSSQIFRNENENQLVKNLVDNEYTKYVDDVLHIPKLQSREKFFLFNHLMKNYKYIICESLKKFLVSRQSSFKKIKEIVFTCKQLLKKQKNNYENKISYDVEKKEIFLSE